MDIQELKKILKEHLSIDAYVNRENEIQIELYFDNEKICYYSDVDTGGY